MPFHNLFHQLLLWRIFQKNISTETVRCIQSNKVSHPELPTSHEDARKILQSLWLKCLFLSSFQLFESIWKFVEFQFLVSRLFQRTLDFLTYYLLIWFLFHLLKTRRNHKTLKFVWLMLKNNIFTTLYEPCTVCSKSKWIFLTQSVCICFQFAFQEKDEREKTEYTDPVTVERFMNLAFVFIGKVLQSVGPDVHVNTEKLHWKIRQNFCLTSLNKDKKYVSSKETSQLDGQKGVDGGL